MERDNGDKTSNLPWWESLGLSFSCSVKMGVSQSEGTNGFLGGGFKPLLNFHPDPDGQMIQFGLGVFKCVEITN